MRHVFECIYNDCRSGPFNVGVKRFIIHPHACMIVDVGLSKVGSKTISGIYFQMSSRRLSFHCNLEGARISNHPKHNISFPTLKGPIGIIIFQKNVYLFQVNIDWAWPKWFSAPTALLYLWGAPYISAPTGGRHRPWYYGPAASQSCFWNAEIAARFKRKHHFWEHDCWHDCCSFKTRRASLF